MFDFFYSLYRRIFSSRRMVIAVVMILFSCILISRLFVLQILRGADYQNNYNLRIEREETIEASRGNIYDRNGELLAYNKLAYAVTIEDTGNYRTSNDRNTSLNEELKEIINAVEKYGDTLDLTFGIALDSSGEYVFNDSGTALQRFRADVFGRTTINELGFNPSRGFNEAEATPDQIMDYLCGSARYNVPEDFGKALRFKVAVLRYRMGLNSYQKYIATTIAYNVSNETVAYIKENQSRLEGADIKERSIRVYDDAECFSNIIGYTGTISTDEYNELSENDDSYSLNDTIGKAGLEQYFNKELMGTKGSQTIYVDSLGNLIQTAEYTEPEAGNDIYLSIDKELQKNVYNLLEQEIAGILYSKIENIDYFNKENASSDIIIPITDVYFALLNNYLINSSHFTARDASEIEKSVNNALESKREGALSVLASQLTEQRPIAYESLSDEYQTYSTYIVRMLKSQGIFDEKLIDSSDSMQIAWTSEELSVREYLAYAIERGWIDITTYMDVGKYVDLEELYIALVDYTIEKLKSDNGFLMQCAYYAIREHRISGSQLCAILYDQGILEEDPDTRNGLLNGSIDAYSFMKNKIQELEITPGQLGLDPCTGSAVIIDPRNGNVLACVSYPGYDSNRLANNVDKYYFTYLNFNSSNPLYNHATQERTAPGSVFKPVTATAGLADGVINIGTQIEDEGIFDKVDNKPQCWFYPDKHGLIDISEALRDSCNYFFYEVGYLLAGDTNYSDSRGIERIANYASSFGLDEKTGVEIEENSPSIATEYPVMAAIGQSNHNFTTISLARYTAAIANNGNVYDLTLVDHVENSKGEVTQTYSPTLRNQVGALTDTQWDAIHYGMRMVVEELGVFEGFPVPVAGKTGTAQQVKNRPNHALFIGYGPYTRPEIAVAARISFGYRSNNAAELCRNIFGVYFKDEDFEDIVSGAANEISTTNTITD